MKLKKSINISSNRYRYSSFGAIYSTCVDILKQLFTSVSANTGGYLPRRFAARRISTTIRPTSVNNNCKILCGLCKQHKIFIKIKPASSHGIEMENT